MPGSFAFLEAGRAQPGDHIVTWNRRSDSGHDLARGAYYIRLEHAGRTVSRTLTLLHR